MDLWVWYSIKTDELILSTSSRFTKKNFSLFEENGYWKNEALFIQQEDFLFLGKL